VNLWLKYVAGLTFLFLMAAMPAAAGTQELVDYDSIRLSALSLHLIELVLAVYISYMALKFFRITKPVSVFLIVYMANGFLIVYSLLYVMVWTADLLNISVSFVNIYLGSQLVFIAMLASLAGLFIHLHRELKRKPAKK